MINIDKLIISPLNVRSILPDENITEDFSQFRDSIKKNGLVHPLTVILNNDTNKYEIIAGQRRYNAMKELEFKDIRCTVISNTTLETEQIVLSLTENIHRNNMKLSDRVKTYNKLFDKYYKMDTTKKDKDIFDEIAETTNTDKKIIKQFKAISHLPDKILDNLDKTGKDKISIDFAIELTKIGIEDEEEFIQIIELFHDVNMTDRIKLMKKILGASKYDCDKITFHKYLENIGKIQTTFLKDIKEKEQKEKEIREEIIRQQKIREPIKPQKTDNIEAEYKENEYIDKMQKVIEENNNSEYITTTIDNPELQNIYREATVAKFNKCIISDMDSIVCSAVPIVPFSELKKFDINNGILLNNILHKLFEKYYWSISPETFRVKIFVPPSETNIYNLLEQYNDKYIGVLEKHIKIIEYLTCHYNIASKMFIPEVVASKTIEQYIIIKINNMIEYNNCTYLIKDNNFTFSKIKNVIINNINIKIDSYKQIISYIYEQINNIDKILKNTIISIVNYEKHDNGYSYNKKIGISCQGVDANKAILEIIKQCFHNNISCEIKIELKK